MSSYTTTEDPSPTPARPIASAIRSGEARHSMSPPPEASTDGRLPVEVHGTGDVAGGVQRGGRAIRPPAHVEHPQVAAAQVLGEPLGRGEKLVTGEFGHTASGDGGRRGPPI